MTLNLILSALNKTEIEIAVTYLNFGVVLRTLHPSLDSSSTHSGREAEARGSGDSVLE